MNNQNNKNEQMLWDLIRKAIDGNVATPRYFEGINTNSNSFKVSPKPISYEIDLADIINMIDDEFVKSLLKENTQTEQEKTITKDEDNKDLSDNINKRVKIIHGKYEGRNGIIEKYSETINSFGFVEINYEIALINEDGEVVDRCLVAENWVEILENDSKCDNEIKDEDDSIKKISMNMANKLKQCGYSLSDIVNMYNTNMYNVNMTKDQQEQCKKECYEALVKSSQSTNNTTIKDEELTEKELNELSDRLMKEYFDSCLQSTKENGIKIGKTLKQIDDEMKSNVGKQGRVINHPHLKDGCIVDILDFSKDLGKYIIKADDFLTTHASYEQIEIIKDKEEIKKFEPIIIEAYDCDMEYDYSMAIYENSAIANVFNDDMGNEFDYNFNLEELIDKNVLEFIRDNYWDYVDEDEEEEIEVYLKIKLRCLYLNKEKDKLRKQYSEIIKQYNTIDNDYNEQVISLIKLKKEMMN